MGEGGAPLFVEEPGEVVVDWEKFLGGGVADGKEGVVIVLDG